MLFRTIIYIFTKKVMNFIDELKWRGMINDITPGLEKIRTWCQFCLCWF